jgi:hypothetical protein
MEYTVGSGIILEAWFAKLTVNKAFAPDDLSWNSSSEAEYAAFAGVAMPESLCVAYANVIEST